MKKDEFMKELDYLLQDIPDEDKADAIAYYRDYLEEAGPEKEEETLRDLGSPERIAAIIRSDLRGDLEEGGGFTENGYEDERFREPNFQIVERPKTPECREDAGEKAAGGAPYGSAYGYGYGPGPQAAGGSAQGASYGSAHGPAYGSTYGSGPREAREGRRAGRPRWSWWQIVGMILLACIAVPVILPLVFGIGGGTIGLVVGALSLFGGGLVAVTIGLAAVTFAFLLAGILLIIFGFAHMAFPPQGILYIGTGIGILGLGFLCLSLCGLYYGRFLPWLGTSIINLVSRILHRKERRREKVY